MIAHEQASEKATKGSKGPFLERLVIWLESLGIDCSEQANGDDAFVVVVMASVIAGMAMYVIYPFWSGVILAATVCNAWHWVDRKYPKAR